MEYSTKRLIVTVHVNSKNEVKDPEPIPDLPEKSSLRESAQFQKDQTFRWFNAFEYLKDIIKNGREITGDPDSEIVKLRQENANLKAENERLNKELKDRIQEIIDTVNDVRETYGYPLISSQPPISAPRGGVVTKKTIRT
jgi:hypothetical protein